MIEETEDEFENSEILTGFLCPVIRGGKVQNLDLLQLTSSELEQYASENPNKGWMMAKALVIWIKKNVSRE